MQVQCPYYQCPEIVSDRELRAVSIAVYCTNATCNTVYHYLFNRFCLLKNLKLCITEDCVKQRQLLWTVSTARRQTVQDSVSMKMRCEECSREKDSNYHQLLHSSQVNEYKCDNCGKLNCILCKAQHEGKSCQEYQEDLKMKEANDMAAQLTQAMLEVSLMAVD